MSEISADKKLPFPTRKVQCQWGEVEEYLVPDDQKKAVLQLLYPFLPIPSLKAKRFDLHADKKFVVREFKVTYENGVNRLVSPYYFSSGGTVIDWMPI